MGSMKKYQWYQSDGYLWRLVYDTEKFGAVEVSKFRTCFQQKRDQIQEPIPCHNIELIELRRVGLNG
jgi:hypothetical protein